MLPLAYRRAWIAGGIALVAAVLFGSLLPVPALPEVPGGDKLHHLVAYGLLAVWFAGMVRPGRELHVAVVLLALGGAIELLQGLPALGRSREAVDMVANGWGVLIGLVLARLGLQGWCLHVERWLGARHG
ncbi:MAG TPA: hypothetical protein VLT59_15985 [Steroidobacteraceae bacterium]|nr:hypothetical protein [Steroidobacteraceae bacterium]